MAEMNNLILGSVFWKRIQPNKDVMTEGMTLIIPKELLQIHLKSCQGEIRQECGRYQRIIG